MQDYKNKLEQVYYKASTEQIIRGKNWYSDTYKLARNFSWEFNRTIAQVAGMLSVLSVGVRWERNVIDVYNLLTSIHNNEVVNTKLYTSYKSQVNKAIAITEFKEESEIERIIGKGLKTLSFFWCICEPTCDSVVVDRWICRAAGWDKNYFPKEKAYYEIAQPILELAKELGYAPPELQAIIWLSAKENNE